MYPHFIEVTRSFRDGEMWKALINVDSIISIEDHNIFTVNCIKDGDDEVSLWVEETYEELQVLIRKAGAQIDRGDPRVDISRPLTLEELKEMTGEPVWDSNNRIWLMVYDGDWSYPPDPDMDYVRMINRYGCKDIWLGKKDLLAKPLYRMKGR